MKRLIASIFALASGAILPALAANYYDPADGSMKSSPNATTLTIQTALTGGWYVVPSGTTTIAGRIVVSGSVNLLICDGAALNANSGITVAEGASLTIWGQGGEYAPAYGAPAESYTAPACGGFSEIEEDGELPF